MNPEEFRAALIAQFPALTQEVEDWHDLVHLQASAFARLTREAIDAGDDELVRRCFAFAHSAFMNADPPLKNALYVSYLEELDFDTPRQQRARQFMSPQLRNGWQEIMDYLAEIGAAIKKNPGSGKG
jgi:hypothetical protein